MGQQSVIALSLFPAETVCDQHSLCELSLVFVAQHAPLHSSAPGSSHGPHDGYEQGHERAVHDPAAREVQVAEAMARMKAIYKDMTKQFAILQLVRLKWKGVVKVLPVKDLMDRT